MALAACRDASNIAVEREEKAGDRQLLDENMREIARSASKSAASVAQRNRPLVRTVEEVEREVDELAERLKFKEQERLELAAVQGENRVLREQLDKEKEAHEREHERGLNRRERELNRIRKANKRLVKMLERAGGRGLKRLAEGRDSGDESGETPEKHRKTG